MVLVPYKRFIIETTLTIDEAMQILLQIVQPKRFWPNPFSEKRRQFVGAVSKEGFRFIRNVYYLNSFLPAIKGTFNSSNGVTRITITMACNPCVVITMTVAFTFIGYILTSVLMGLISHLLVIFGSLALGALGYLICILAFKAASNTDRDLLVKLFL